MASHNHLDGADDFGANLLVLRMLGVQVIREVLETSRVLRMVLWTEAGKFEKKKEPRLK